MTNPSAAAHSRIIDSWLTLLPVGLLGLAKNIKVPTIMTHGSKDKLMDVEGAKKLFDEIGAKDKTLHIFDDPKVGGTVHCAHDCWVHQMPILMDWLEDHV